MYRHLIYIHCASHILVHVVVRWCSRTLEQENFANEISSEILKILKSIHPFWKLSDCSILFVVCFNVCWYIGLIYYERQPVSTDMNSQPEVATAEKYFLKLLFVKN